MFSKESEWVVVEKEWERVAEEAKREVDWLSW